MKATIVIPFASTLLWLLFQTPHLRAQEGKQSGPKVLQINCRVVDSQNTGVPGADVFVYSAPNSVRKSREPFLVSGFTDGSGEYQFDYSISPGEKFVRIHFAAREKGGGVGVTPLYIDVEASKDSRESATVPLQDTQDLKLRITRPNGSPAVGLTVWVAGCAPAGSNRFMKMIESPKWSGEFWNATTDEHGACVIHEIPAHANIYLTHKDERYAHFTGKHKIIVDALQPGAKVHPLELQDGASIRGKVTLPDGTPAENVRVRIVETHPYKTAYGSDTFTDGKGGFHVKHVPGSTYRFYMHIPPRLSSEWINIPMENPLTLTAGADLVLPDKSLVKVATVTGRILNAETEEEIEDPILFHLPPGTHVVRYRSSRVYPDGYLKPKAESFEITIEEGDRETVAFRFPPVQLNQLISGTVLNLRGNPVPGARVYFSAHSGENQITQCSEGGTFSFSPPDPTTTSGTVFATYQESGKPQFTGLEAVRRSQQGIELRQEKKWVRATGRVIDESGTPIPGVEVKWRTDDVNLHFSPMPSTAITDQTGQYSFERLWPSRSYRFSCRPNGYGTARHNDLSAKAGSELEVPDMQLPNADRKLTGRVVNSEGQPVTGATVVINGKRQANFPRTQSDAQGRFKFENLVAERVMVRASVKNESYSSEQRKWVDLPRNENPVVKLILPDAKGSVSGVVIDENGNPVPNAKLYSFDVNRETRAGPDGSFVLKGIVEGWFTLIAQVSDENGEREERVRVNTGMQNVRVVLRSEPDPPYRPPTEAAATAMIGKRAPDLVVDRWLTSPALDQRNDRGKVRLLDFWGITCGPCVANMPNIQKFCESNRDQRFEFVALHWNTPPGELEEFFEKHPDYNFRVAVLPDSRKQESGYPILALPTYVVISPAGRVSYLGSNWEQASSTATRLLTQLKRSEE